MHLWRSLPEGQLLAVLRWLSGRREHLAASNRLIGAAAPAAAEAGEKAPAPLH